ncbi:class I SAM-dependent methyltransferase [Candidatus Parcubacteria bacterium]|nr:MAG: class I SAM-dependent methyltransferase [Candidatus Parcubacteria bacterium]
MDDRYSRVIEIGNWLRQLDEQERKNRIWKLGLLTGWRKLENGSFMAPNFERALVIERIIELTKPRTFLEIGTGRGLGCLSAAQAGRIYDCNLHITTVDTCAPDKKQNWAIQVNGENQVINASRNDVWSKYVNNEIIHNILQVTGPTTKVLPRLLSQRKEFDFIFIDGGHDPYTVIHDLSYASKLMTEIGIILMDDFSPLDRWANGISMSIHHAKKTFNNIIVFQSEGIVFGFTENTEFPRGMVIMLNKKFEDLSINRFGLFCWKIINRAISFGYGKRGSPIRIKSKN